MRKYHQLLLFVVSCISVTVLLFYKSENSRLKDVLSAVNFFSRKDAAVLRQARNVTAKTVHDFTRPLPVWQVVGDSFHAYAAYWHRNELLVGGEAVTLVVGKSGAMVNFHCSALYDDRIVQGKFHFQRVSPGLGSAAGSPDFTSYNFFCRLRSVSGLPQSIAFTDLSVTGARSEYRLRLRHVKRNDEDTTTTRQLATICVDLVSFNASSSFAKDGELNWLQFFYHHMVLGVEHFVVYNADEIPQRILQKIQLTKGIQLHLLPFNFPFNYENSMERVRSIVEADCLLRNMNLARHVVLLSPDEFFLPNAKLHDDRSVLRSMHLYSAELTRFEVHSFSVCMDRSNRLLINNSLYDPELQMPHRIFVYRPHVPSATVPTGNSVATSMTFPLTLAMAHKYTACDHVGKDGLHNWRNSLRQDFMLYIQEVLGEVNGLMPK